MLASFHLPLERLYGRLFTGIGPFSVFPEKNITIKFRNVPRRLLSGRLARTECVHLVYAPGFGHFWRHTTK